MATQPEVFVPQAAPLTQEHRGALALFWKRWGVYYLFLAPFLTVFTVFVIAPVLVAIYLSFTYFNVLEPRASSGGATTSCSSSRTTSS